MADDAHPYRNASDPRNGPTYHTGKSCVETGCDDPAGTAWSPHWCFAHNVERMDRIGRNLEALVERL